MCNKKRIKDNPETVPAPRLPQQLQTRRPRATTSAHAPPPSRPTPPRRRRHSSAVERPTSSTTTITIITITIHPLRHHRRHRRRAPRCSCSRGCINPSSSSASAGVASMRPRGVPPTSWWIANPLANGLRTSRSASCSWIRRIVQFSG